MAAKRKAVKRTASRPKRGASSASKQKHMEIEWFTVLTCASVIILAFYLLLS